MLEIKKDKAVKLFSAIPKKQLGVVRATSPKRLPVTIITKGDKQIIRICDGKFWA